MEWDCRGRVCGLAEVPYRRHRLLPVTRRASQRSSPHGRVPAGGADRGPATRGVLPEARPPRVRALAVGLAAGLLFCGPATPGDAPSATDASLQAILDGAGVPNPLRADLQRPIDPRLERIRKHGFRGSRLFRGRAHAARDAAAVRALSGRLRPGDQLVLAAGEWKDASFTFAGSGTESSPILVRPESPGAVVFTGSSSVIFTGEHLVITDLEFRGCPSPATARSSSGSAWTPIIRPTTRSSTASGSSPATRRTPRTGRASACGR